MKIYYVKYEKKINLFKCLFQMRWKPGENDIFPISSCRILLEKTWKMKVVFKIRKSRGAILFLSAEHCRTSFVHKISSSQVRCAYICTCFLSINNYTCTALFLTCSSLSKHSTNETHRYIHTLSLSLSLIY